MDPSPLSVSVAVAVSLVATGMWLALFVRSVRHRCEDRRHSWFVMPVVGLMAAVGTLASAIGYAESSGTISIVVSQNVLSLVASMGRGALAMGGFIALMVYHPAGDR